MICNATFNNISVISYTWRSVISYTWRSVLLVKKTGENHRQTLFSMFGGHVFQQRIGIPLGTNCASILADLLLYSSQADFIQGLLQKNEKKLTRSFNFTFRHIDDAFSLNNSKLGDFVDHIYSIALEIKDT